MGLPWLKRKTGCALERTLRLRCFGRGLIVLTLLLWGQQIEAGQDEAVVVGIFSAYQSEVSNSKLPLFLAGLASTLRRPVHISTFVEHDAVSQMRAAHPRLVLIVPRDITAYSETATMAPLVSARITMALYAKPGAGTDKLADIRLVSAPRYVDSTPFAKELAQINPSIQVVSLGLGTTQLRALLNGAVDGAVLNTGLYANLTPSLRGQYILRYTFARTLRIDVFASSGFSAADVSALKAYLLNLNGGALSQIQQVYGVSGFETFE